ncbi:type III secretion protein [Orrella sp. JC864]|uniref:type III secretion protein n=1 Tax=Orrella sp. JC864 TaxID=3120298 RepID=UPI0030092BC1
MSVFDELLAIKRFREDQAELALARQRQAHGQARDAWTQAQARLRDYRGWARRRERELYDELCARVVRVREIEAVLTGVGLLREAEREHERTCQAAQDALERAAQHLAERRQAHGEAVRRTGKFVELARLHLAEHLGALERQEDAELEEAASLAREREDWEQHEEVDFS